MGLGRIHIDCVVLRRRKSSEKTGGVVWSEGSEVYEIATTARLVIYIWSALLPGLA